MPRDWLYWEDGARYAGTARCDEARRPHQLHTRQGAWCVSIHLYSSHLSIISFIGAGGASGGYTTGTKEAIELLRNKSRPYLFSNTLAPAIVGASLKMFDKISKTTELRDKLEVNTKLFRKLMGEAGVLSYLL